MSIVIEVEGKRLEFARGELISYGDGTAWLSAKVGAAMLKALPSGFGNVRFVIHIGAERLEGCRLPNGINWGNVLEVRYKRARDV